MFGRCACIRGVAVCVWYWVLHTWHHVHCHLCSPCGTCILLSLTRLPDNPCCLNIACRCAAKCSAKCCAGVCGLAWRYTREWQRGRVNTSENSYRKVRRLHALHYRGSLGVPGASGGSGGSAVSGGSGVSFAWTGQRTVLAPDGMHPLARSGSTFDFCSHGSVLLREFLFTGVLLHATTFKQCEWCVN